MRFSVLIIILIAFTFNSCKKIKGDAKEIEGTYEWAYSSSTTYNGDHGSSSTSYQYPTADLRKAIKIQKRKVIFYENGKEVDSKFIRNFSSNKNGIGLSLGTEKKGYTLDYSDGILYMLILPRQMNDFIHVYYKN